MSKSPGKAGPGWQLLPLVGRVRGAEERGDAQAQLTGHLDEWVASENSVARLRCIDGRVSSIVPPPRTEPDVRVPGERQKASPKGCRRREWAGAEDQLGYTA